MSRWSTAVTLLVASLATRASDAFVQAPSTKAGIGINRRRRCLSLPALGVKQYMDSLSNPQPPQQPPSDGDNDIANVNAYANASANANANANANVSSGQGENDAHAHSHAQQPRSVRDVAQDNHHHPHSHSSPSYPPIVFPDSPADAGLHDFAEETVSSYFVQPEQEQEQPELSSDTSSSGISTGSGTEETLPVSLSAATTDVEVNEHASQLELEPEPTAPEPIMAAEETYSYEPVTATTPTPVSVADVSASGSEPELTLETTTDEKIFENVVDVAELELDVQQETTEQLELVVEATEAMEEVEASSIQLEEAEAEEIEAEENILLVDDDSFESEMAEAITLSETDWETEASDLDVNVGPDTSDEIEIEVPKSDDENVSLAIGSMSTVALGDLTSRTYTAHRESLSASTARNRKRVSRSEFERKKAAEKIFAIKARMEQQIKDVGRELDDKLHDMQRNYEAEAAQIEKFLQYQVSYEASRKESISSLITTIQSSIETKREEVRVEDKITAEMIDVRSKLKTGNISSQLDELIEKKQKVAELENEQLNDLADTLVLVEDILERTVRREAQIQTVLDNIRPVDLTSPNGVDYDFNDLVALESMWQQAAVELGSDGEKLEDLKLRFDDVLLTKIEITGGEVPDSLKVVTKKLDARKAANQRANQINDMSAIIKEQVRAKQAAKASGATQELSKKEERDQKEDYELIGRAAKSLSSAAIDSAKAGIFGIRAIVDTVRDEDVAGKLKKQDAESMKAIGEIAKKLGQTKSAEQASTALKDTGSDLSDAFKAIGSLTKRSLDKMKENKDN